MKHGPDRLKKAAQRAKTVPLQLMRFVPRVAEIITVRWLDVFIRRTWADVGECRNFLKATYRNGNIRT